LQQVPSQIIFLGENAEPFSGSLTNLSRIGSKEHRCSYNLSSGQEEIQAEVMTFHTQCPLSGLRRISIDGEIIFFRVTTFSRIVFHHLQNLFQTHDGCRLDEATLAETAC